MWVLKETFIVIRCHIEELESIRNTLNGMKVDNFSLESIVTSGTIKKLEQVTGQ